MCLLHILVSSKLKNTNKITCIWGVKGVFKTPFFPLICANQLFCILMLEINPHYHSEARKVFPWLQALSTPWCTLRLIGFADGFSPWWPTSSAVSTDNFLKLWSNKISHLWTVLGSLRKSSYELANFRLPMINWLYEVTQLFGYLTILLIGWSPHVCPLHRSRSVF